MGVQEGPLNEARMRARCPSHEHIIPFFRPKRAAAKAVGRASLLFSVPRWVGRRLVGRCSRVEGERGGGSR
eukprot:scaffold54453_cov15-Tisochrysis_lutea.AAC.1